MITAEFILGCKDDLDLENKLNRMPVSTTKRIYKAGKFYRMRRGKLVQIPDKWVGQVTHPQTISKRKSKASQGRRYKRKCMRTG